MKYNVIEMFNSIEGEGKRQGELCTFIRFAGCNLKCSYCDTKHAQSADKSTEYTQKEIVNWIKKNALNENITITGGEPLLQDIAPLITALHNKDYTINIETNGSIDIKKEMFRIYSNRLFFTLDYKLPRSKMETKMLLKNWQYLRDLDVLKFVISSNKDLQRIKELLEQNHLLCHIYLSPVIEKISPVDIVDYMKENNNVFNRCKLQLQLHKQIGVQ